MSLNTCGSPPGPFSIKASRPPRNGSPTRPARSSAASQPRSLPGSAAALPPTATPGPSAPAPRTTPPPWQKAGPSPPASSKAQQDGWSRTEWTSQAPDGAWKAPRPSSSSAPSPSAATSRPTGAITSAASTSASTTRNTATATFSQHKQLTSKEPHPLRYQDSLDEVVQPVKVDIGQNRGNDPALRCPAERGAPYPVFQVSGLKHVTHKPEEPVIVNVLRESPDHKIMIKTPETVGDITFDKPGCPGPGLSHVPQCGMASPARTETVRIIGELRLV